MTDDCPAPSGPALERAGVVEAIGAAHAQLAAAVGGARARVPALGTRIVPL